jgi:LacI family transcriptional regulator
VINNGPRPVSDETRERVVQAIERLGYKPNRLARGLTTGRTHAVGIVIPDISDPFFPELILGAEGVARERGYSVFLCNANRNPELELGYVDLLVERQVDGFMIAGSRLEMEGLKTATDGYNVVILTPYEIPDAVLFSINDFEGGRQIGEYLLSLGHRRIRFVEGTWSGSARNRANGLIKALETAGLSTDDVIAASVSPVTIDEGRRAVVRLLKDDPTITALVCYNDVLALGVLQACAEIGKRVPEDLSVAGFDDIPEASRSQPPLTTFRIDRQDLGEAMMNRLLDIVEGQTKRTERIIVSGRLVIRGSCAQPSARV